MFNGAANRESGGKRKNQHFRRRQRGPQDYRAIDSGGSLGLPSIRAAAAAGGLFFGKKNGAFGSAFCGGGHGGRVGRASLIKVLNVIVEDRAAQKWAQNLRQEQVRN